MHIPHMAVRCMEMMCQSPWQSDNGPTTATLQILSSIHRSLEGKSNGRNYPSEPEKMLSNHFTDERQARYGPDLAFLDSPPMRISR